MSFAAIKGRLATWREWELNPIVIKELRQAVRSWTVTGMLLLFLTVLFVTSLVLLATNLFEPNQNMGLGATMFGAFLLILAGASVCFIPLYVGIRMAGDALPIVCPYPLPMRAKIEQDSVISEQSEVDESDAERFFAAH